MASLRENAGRKHGFTLTELLVVIGILGLLMSLIMPVLSRGRRMAREASCKSQMKQLAIECQRYLNDWKIHPPWLSTLYPDYLSDKRLLLCPGDFSKPKVSQGGRPDDFPPPFNQFAELDDNKYNAAEDNIYCGRGRMGQNSQTISANSLRNDEVEFCSYSYEFACPGCSYWGGGNYPDQLGNGDGLVSWREVKVFVEQEGYTSVQRAVDDKAKYGGRVPLIRCFWHTPTMNPNAMDRTRVINYASGDHNIYISDASKDGWKRDWQNF